MNETKKFITAMPKLTLGVMDKVYLATAVKSVDKMTFVYTLACLKKGENYNLWPTTEISTFDNEKDAAIYHKTINQIMQYQERHNGIQQIRQMLSDKVKEFRENTK